MAANTGSFEVIGAASDPQNPQDVANFLSTFASFARQQRLYVQWVACQMPPTVPFLPLRLRILNEWLLPLVLQKAVLLRNLIK
jgi:hypothetical protein